MAKQTLRLDEPKFVTAQLTRIARVPDKTFRSWNTARGKSPAVMQLGSRHFSGRFIYTLLDVIQAAVVSDLIRRVGLGPSDAVEASRGVVKYVASCAPADADGHPVLDFNHLAPDMALVMANDDAGQRVSEVVRIGHGGGYARAGGPWSRTHVVVPISALVWEVLLAATIELDMPA